MLTVKRDIIVSTRLYSYYVFVFTDIFYRDVVSPLYYYRDNISRWRVPIK